MADTAETPHTPPKLPVGELVIAAYRHVFVRTGTLLVLLLTIFCLGIILVVIPWIAFGELNEIRPDWWPRSVPFPSALEEIFTLLLFVAFAVSWHRTLLVPDVIFRVRSLFRWRIEHLKFLGFAVLLGLLSFGLSALWWAQVHPAIAEVFGPAGRNDEWTQRAAARFLRNDLQPMVVGIATILISARFLLVFPSIAIGSAITFRDSWSLTRANGLRLAIATAFAVFPLQLMAFVVVVTIGFSDVHLASPFLRLTIEMLQVAISVGVISLSYRHLVGAPDRT